MEMATLLARKKEIDINSNLKRQEIRSNWAVVIKKIPMNMPKDMIVTIIFEFGEIKSIKIQLIGMWQKAVMEFANFGSPLSGSSGLNGGLFFVLVDDSFLIAHVASLEWSLELLTNQVSGLVHKLSNMGLVLQALSSSSKASATVVVTKENLALDMIVDDSELVLQPPSSDFPSMSTLGLSSSKVLTSKVGSLESKLVALKTSVNSVLAKLDYLCAGLDPLLFSSS
ncbi:hypothetical protein G9A89_009341 [Geosiphon pyriformis]|nr:hypothetical protein G9A89_009341 [Geosiphon pyriformis]